MPRFKAEQRSRLQRSWDYLRSLKGYLQTAQFAAVEKRLQFIAPPRSGHTLIGSLLDAHPEMVIAHEMDSLGYYENGYSQVQIDYLLTDSSRKFTRDGRQWMGYDYEVPGQWQGKFKRLRVIGDKSGGRTARRIYHADDPTQLLEHLRLPQGRELVFLHLIRNPYDNITTMMKRTNKRKNEGEHDENLRKKIRHFFVHASGVARLRTISNYRIIDVHHEDFVGNPKGELERICQILDLDTTKEYLDACAGLVWEKPRKSRHNTDLWTPEQLEFVASEMRAFPWFDRYQA